MMLVTDLIPNNIAKYGEYPCIYYQDREITNMEVDKAARELAFFLHSMGIKKGDCVLVSMSNCPEVIYSYQAILRLGAIVIPVMHLLNENEFTFILEHSEAKAVITTSDVFSKIHSASARLSGELKVICMDQLPSEIPHTNMEVTDWQKGKLQISENRIQEIYCDIHETDLAVILYTSGTTGRPKGVMLTHRNLSANVIARTSFTDGKRGTMLGVLPLAHVYGFSAMNALFHLGNAVVIFQKFDVVKIFEAIEKYQIKSCSLVPAMIHEMVSSPFASHYDLSSLEAIESGSTSLPASLREEVRKKFQAEIYDAYGLSEASPSVSRQRKDIPIKEGSVGLPLPGLQIKIVDQNGVELPTGQIGELIVKGDNITPGYYKNEEATKEAIKDGWLFTGDMAKVDEDGYLYIVGRKKELIIRGGFNIYPRDLEELLLKHEEVFEAAVIGVPSERMGEEVIACVIKKTSSTLSEDDLISYCQTHLAKYKTPRRIVFLNELPKNKIGKILKLKLKEIYSHIDVLT
ncbi:class I adenylate-forming enzyme family protein [Bacillus dakarensis]|uniref:class I adenylate-forming enzyme family protein n=1 Tax=Robertmurraya dakarensis TaxID=1926278 RepID=UPI001F1A5F74|nr:AMP-binding protein [Bacillus dakarensis]